MAIIVTDDFFLSLSCRTLVRLAEFSEETNIIVKKEHQGSKNCLFTIRQNLNFGAFFKRKSIVFRWVIDSPNLTFDIQSRNDNSYPQAASRQAPNARNNTDFFVCLFFAKENFSCKAYTLGSFFEIKHYSNKDKNVHALHVKKKNL